MLKYRLNFYDDYYGYKEKVVISAFFIRDPLYYAITKINATPKPH